MKKKKIIPIVFIALLLVSMLCGCDPAGTSTSTDYVGSWMGEYSGTWINWIFTDSTFEYIYSSDSEQLNVLEAKKGSLTVYEDVMFHTISHYWIDTNADNQISDDEWVGYDAVQTFTFTIADDAMTFYGMNSGQTLIFQLVE